MADDQSKLLTAEQMATDLAETMHELQQSMMSHKVQAEGLASLRTELTALVERTKPLAERALEVTRIASEIGATDLRDQVEQLAERFQSLSFSLEERIERIEATVKRVEEIEQLAIEVKNSTEQTRSLVSGQQALAAKVKGLSDQSTQLGSKVGEVSKSCLGATAESRRAKRRAFFAALASILTLIAVGYLVVRQLQADGFLSAIWS